MCKTYAKKMLIVVTVIGMIASMAAIVPAAAAEEGLFFNMSDSLRLYYYMAGKTLLNEDEIASADVNGDGRVDMQDAQIAYQVVSGVLPMETVVKKAKTESEESKALVALSPDLYYGRQQLAAQDERLVKAYDSLGEQVKAFAPQVDLYDFALTVPEMERVIQYYNEDHPEVFWLELSYKRWTWKENGVAYVAYLDMNYSCTKEQADEYTAKMEAKADELLQGIDSTMSEYARELAVHDRIVKACEYDTTFKRSNIHKAVGMLVDGYAVCDGYSRAFQYLMYRCGIQTILVNGWTDGGTMAHIWNAINIDGKWYMVDVTWDDPVFTPAKPEHVGHSYFNITTEEIFKTHKMETKVSSQDKNYAVTYEIPACVATESFEASKAVAISGFDVTVMAPAVAQSIRENGEAIFAPACGTEKFVADFNKDDNFFALVKGVNECLKDTPALQISNSYVTYRVEVNELRGFVTIYMR